MKSRYLFSVIRKNVVSFFAIAFIAAVSIALYVGIQAGNSAGLEAMGRYFANSKLSTAEIRCANGVTQDDLDEIAKWEGVDCVEGGYSQNVMWRDESEKLIVQAISLDDKMNIPTVLEGALPIAENEVAIEQTFANQRGINVGDQLVFEHDGALYAEKFTVTAVINHPYFCRNVINDSRGAADMGMGAASYYVAFSKNAYRSEYYQSTYTVARIRNFAIDDIYYYSDEYSEQEKNLISKWQKLGDERAQLRYEEILNQYHPLIESGEIDTDDMGYANWIIAARSDIGDLRSTMMAVKITGGISYALAVIFFDSYNYSMLCCDFTFERRTGTASWNTESYGIYI